MLLSRHLHRGYKHFTMPFDMKLAREKNEMPPFIQIYHLNVIKQAFVPFETIQLSVIPTKLT